MQTFKQFIEAREVKDIPQNDIREILTHINDPIICVKFGLYCAEDCFHLNDEHTRASAQQCIDLVRKWLRDPESVTEQKLRSARSDASWTADATAGAASWAAYAAANVVLTVNVAIRSDIDGATEATEAAAITAVTSFINASGHQRYSSQWNQIYQQKLQEYIRKLKSLTTTRSGSPTSIEPLKGYDNDYVTIMAALDSLEEIGEIGKEHFVYQDDNGQWVFDLGHDNILRAASREALARLINNNRYYLNALMRIYNANV